MAAMILLVDWAFWRPLVAWAEKFKLEETQAPSRPRSAVLELLRRSHLARGGGAALERLEAVVDGCWRHAVGWREARPAAPGIGRRDRVLAAILWAGLGLLALRGVAFIHTEVAWQEALRVVGLGALTWLRVTAVVLLSALIWTPVGVWIGMSLRVARVVQPLVQLLASFPANFLFPFATIVFLRTHLSLEWGGVLLMALGAQWYLLFNTIAGAMAIPNDLREMTRDLGVRGWLRWRTLVLPGIFPAWITGALTAAGGAWNASIVAEVVSWGDVRLAATGLGAYITQATTAGDWPRIVLGVSVMSAYVVAINRLLWRPLQRRAEARYRLG
jgi:NitT/TauT family transport system permease protein